MGPDCWKIITAMGTAIVALCGALAYVAKCLLASVLARVQDRDATVAQLQAAKYIAQRKKEESP